MKRKLVVVLASLGALLCVLSCSCAPTEASVEVSCDDFGALEHVSKEVVVAVGGTVTVTVCSNPTTGFQWAEAEIGDDAVLEQRDRQFIAPEAKPPLPPGSPGKEVWTFTALKKGTSTVSFEYGQLWEGGEKAGWTLDLTVVVK